MLFCKQKCFWTKCDLASNPFFSAKLGMSSENWHLFIYCIIIVISLHQNCFKDLFLFIWLMALDWEKKEQPWKKNTKASITTFPQERGQEKRKLHQKHNNLKCQVYLSRTENLLFLILALRYHYICNEISFNSLQKKLPFRKYQERLFPGWCWL